MHKNPSSLHHTTKFTFSSDQLQSSFWVMNKNFDSKNVRMEDEEEKSILNEESFENHDYIWSNGNSIILCILSFCIETSYSFEISLITPYFLLFDLSPFIDYSIWLFPPLINILLFPIVDKLMNSTLTQKQKKNLVSIILSVCCLGSFILFSAESLAQTFASKDPFKFQMEFQRFAICFGLIGFLMLDVMNELLNACLENHFNVAKRMNYLDLEEKVGFARYLGKFVGFILPSALALDFGVELIKYFRNLMSFCFTFSFLAFALGLACWVAFFEIKNAPKTIKNQKNLIQIKILSETITSLTFEEIFPGLKLIRSVHSSTLYILAMHFFSTCAILILTVYATSWVGMTILKLSPEDKSNRLLSDLGTSWGSFSLLISLIFSIFLSLLLPLLRFLVPLPLIFFMTQIICCFSLLITYFRQDFTAAFSILPLSGFAIATFNSIPELMIEGEGQKKERLQKLIRINLFFGEVSMFCILPILMNLIPEVDEMVDTIGVGAGMAGISCLFAVMAWKRNGNRDNVN